MPDSVNNDPGDDFARLLVQYDREVFRYILTFVSRHADAEEILQRVATVLWQKFSEYDRTRAFLPWARRVAYFEILKFRTEAARNRLVFREEVMEALADTRETLNPILEAQKLALQECLGKVGEDAVALLKRRYCDAETVATLAAESGKTAKAFYRRLDRLRSLIADCIERRVGSVRAASTSD
jgi:RNA polymerase sigma-70 factor (ECF subfamily)